MLAHVSHGHHPLTQASGPAFDCALRGRAPQVIEVLLFAANPRGTAPYLPREFREIDEEVRLGTFRSAVELILVPGTRPVDCCAS